MRSPPRRCCAERCAPVSGLRSEPVAWSIRRCCHRSFVPATPPRGQGLGSRSVALAEALAGAPPRAPARPDPRAGWRSIRVLDEASVIRRPPGLEFDPGGIGKGLAADIVAGRLAAYGRYAIDCGGDLRVGGSDPGGEPIEIEVRHPVTGAAADVFAIWRGAVATRASIRGSGGGRTVATPIT